MLACFVEARWFNPWFEISTPACASLFMNISVANEFQLIFCRIVYLFHDGWYFGMPGWNSFWISSLKNFVVLEWVWFKDYWSWCASVVHPWRVAWRQTPLEQSCLCAQAFWSHLWPVSKCVTEGLSCDLAPWKSRLGWSSESQDPWQAPSTRGSSLPHKCCAW